MKQKCAVLFTGGKDSGLALHKAKLKYDVEYLVSIIPKKADSFMFHKPDLALLERQADMLQMDLIVKESSGIKEKELKDLKAVLSLIKDKVRAVVVGGIASSYQGGRVKKICRELGLDFYAPLWDYKPEQVWDELLKKKFHIVLTKISCEGLGKEWLGKIIDMKRFDELKKLADKYKFRIDFEGGEAETAVLHMPGFRKEIKIRFGIKSEGKYRHMIKIKEVC